MTVIKSKLTLNLNEFWNMEVDPVATGKRLMKMRIAHNLTQEELSEIICEKCSTTASKNAISNWERGVRVPSTAHIVFLCAIYRCKLDDLVWTFHRSREEAQGREQSVLPVSGLGLDLDRLWEMEVDAVETGKQLRKMRLAYNLTQDALAEIICEKCREQACKNAVSSWERGVRVPSMAHIVFLSFIYRCTLDGLVRTYRHSHEEVGGRDQPAPLFVAKYTVQANGCGMHWFAFCLAGGDSGGGKSTAGWRIAPVKYGII